MTSAGKGGEILGQVRTREEPVWFLVVGRSAAVADVIQVDGEFGCIERLAFAEILARRHDFVPGFERHNSDNLERLWPSGAKWCT